jgi:hypothetical protein
MKDHVYFHPLPCGQVSFPVEVFRIPVKIDPVLGP